MSDKYRPLCIFDSFDDANIYKTSNCYKSMSIHKKPFIRESCIVNNTTKNPWSCMCNECKDRIFTCNYNIKELIIGCDFPETITNMSDFLFEIEKLTQNINLSTNDQEKTIAVREFFRIFDK